MGAEFTRDVECIDKIEWHELKELGISLVEVEEDNKEEESKKAMTEFITKT